MFSNKTFTIVAQISRAEIQTLIQDNGGIVLDPGVPRADYIIVDKDLSNNHFAIDRQWIRDCIGAGEILPDEAYRPERTYTKRGSIAVESRRSNGKTTRVEYSYQDDVQILKHFMLCNFKNSLTTTWKLLAEEHPAHTAESYRNRFKKMTNSDRHHIMKNCLKNDLQLHEKVLKDHVIACGGAFNKFSTWESLSEKMPFRSAADWKEDYFRSFVDVNLPAPFEEVHSENSEKVDIEAISEGNDVNPEPVKELVEDPVVLEDEFDIQIAADIKTQLDDEVSLDLADESYIEDDIEKSRLMNIVNNSKGKRKPSIDFTLSSSSMEPVKKRMNNHAKILNNLDRPDQFESESFASESEQENTRASQQQTSSQMRENVRTLQDLYPDQDVIAVLHTCSGHAEVASKILMGCADEVEELFFTLNEDETLLRAKTGDDIRPLVKLKGRGNVEERIRFLKGLRKFRRSA